MRPTLSFSYSTNYNAGHQLFRLEGYFGFQDVKEVSGIVRRHLKRVNLTQLQLDLAALEDIDSSALSCLMHLHDDAKRRHCIMNFVCSPGKVRDKLQSAANVNNLQVELS